MSRYPNVLCIHLNRLQFGAKDGRFVKFQQILSLDNINNKVQYYNNYRVNNINSIFNDNEYQMLNQYILMSVIVHHGNDCGGHYTTYKRTVNLPSNINDKYHKLEWKSFQDLKLIEKYSEWYHISDEFVNKVKINQVLMSQAYMLFYQKNGASNK